MSDRVTRRTLVKRGLVAGGALAGGGAALGGVLSRQGSSRKSVTAARVAPPNILVVLVDQLRTPQWFQNEAVSAGLMPNLARLRKGGVFFAGHYTAANDCSPSRAALLTGLHAQQTGCLVTSGSTLAPQFPTWGTMLREHGYETRWYGKWHLVQGDNVWTKQNRGALEPYGFSGGTYPSPDGGPGEGWRVDPHIAAQFAAW
ncbi:MAG: sulfatase-like hydrolase/transferase [Solirubrobacteraceae bacterium]